jgi:hypothetical protein
MIHLFTLLLGNIDIPFTNGMTFRNIIEEFPPAHHFDGVNITLSNNPNEPEIIDDFSQTVVDGSNLILTYISFTEVLHHAVEEFESECMSGTGGGGGIHKFEQTLSFYERTFHPEVTSSTGGEGCVHRLCIQLPAKTDGLAPVLVEKKHLGRDDGSVCPFVSRLRPIYVLN